MMKRLKGFTLIELMIVVSVIAILAAIAYPSYMDSVRKSRRTDGMAALVNVQLAQQKLRSNCRFFAGGVAGAEACGADAAASTVRAGAMSQDGWYAISIANASGTGYTVTATPQGDQVNDSAEGAACTLVLTVSAANPNGVGTPAACWD
jgi:type IV pilus assembly protein PilE